MMRRRTGCFSCGSWLLSPGKCSDLSLELCWNDPTLTRGADGACYLEADKRRACSSVTGANCRNYFTSNSILLKMCQSSVWLNLQTGIHHPLSVFRIWGIGLYWPCHWIPSLWKCSKLLIWPLLFWHIGIFFLSNRTIVPFNCNYFFGCLIHTEVRHFQQFKFRTLLNLVTK